MPGCKIYDMNEVADSRAIRSIIVVSPNVQLLTLSDCHLRHKRQQIVRNAQRVFTDEPAFMRTNRIEVAQNTNPPTVVGPIKILYYFCDEKLCTAVRICRSDGMLLVQRQVHGSPINGCGRTKNERLNACSCHG